MTEQPPHSESLAALAGRYQEQLLAEQKTTLAVIEARKTGASWAHVASCLNISRSQAWNRYRRLDAQCRGQQPPDDDDGAPTA